MKYPAICMLTVLGSLLASAETKVKLEDLPPAVQTAVQRETQGATIVGAAQEREQGRTVFEVETKRNGKTRDLTFAENGSLLEIEQEVELNRIPPAAREALQKRAGDGTIQKVESVSRGSHVSYEAEIRSPDGKHREVAVQPDGSVL